MFAESFPPCKKNGKFYCRYCDNTEIEDNPSKWILDGFIELEIIKIIGSRGFKFDNVKKWDNTGISISKLPNSEVFEESYRCYALECPECGAQYLPTEEETITLVSDDLMEEKK